MFDCVMSILGGITFVRVRSKASVCPRLSDDVIDNSIVVGCVFEIVWFGRTKNGIVLYELHQKRFEFIAMYKTQIPYVNVMNKVQR